MANPLSLKLLAAPLLALALLSFTACSTSADTTPVESLAGFAASSAASE